MKLTFLGHQGWMVESRDYRLLVDPIVTPYFRNSAFSRVWVYPPRRLDLDRLDRIDGIYFSHEHEDHFHVESIHALPRTAALYLSANMSEAAERILREMGFSRVRRLYATEEIAFGAELTMTLFPPPASPPERWVLQPFIRGDSWLDSFFDPVDCAVSPELLEWLRRKSAPTVGLVCLANNQQIARGIGNPCDLRPKPKSLRPNFDPAGVLGSHLALGDLPGLRYLAIVGGGFIEETCPFGTFKCASHDKLADVLQEYSHEETRVFAPSPGDSVVPADPFRRVEPPSGSSLVVPSPEGQRALERAEALAEAYRPGRDYEPVTGRRELDDAGERELDGRLAELASRLAAHPFHWELMQQGYARGTGGTSIPYGDGRLLLTLLRGKGPRLLEYQPIRRAFVPLAGPPPADAVAEYPAGFECWASDLLALLRGELCVFELVKYRYRFWSPERAYFGEGHFGVVLEQLFAPEVSNETTYTLYRRAYDRALGNTAPARA